jgi:CheY-like chemotaxis protein
MRMLENLGHRVDVVGNGLEAVNAARQLPYDIILMDCQMPEMDGYGATTEIRRLEGAARHTPIVAMTANAMPGDRERCLSIGMDDYVSKPIRVKELYGVLGMGVGGAGEAGDSRPVVPAADISTSVAGVDDCIDDSILDEVLEFAGKGGEELVRDLVDLFFAEVPARLDSIRRGVEERDPERVTRGAHAMKGGASNLGAIRAAALCAQLEKQSRAADLSGAGSLVIQLEQELERIRVRLRARVEAGVTRV